MKDTKNDFDLDIVYLDDEADTDKQLNENLVKSGPPAKKNRTKKRDKKKSTPTVPVGKVVKGTGKLAYRIIGIGFRLSTFALISYILYLLFTNFWVGKNEYGDILTMFSEKNYTLIAYSGTALFLLLYELISLLWSFSSRHVKEDNRVRKLDTGRGFCSFIFIFIGAVASEFFAYKIPSSPAFLTGIEGALTIYGSLTEILLPLCIAGVICSLLRKLIFH